MASAVPSFRSSSSSTHTPLCPHGGLAPISQSACVYSIIKYFCLKFIYQRGQDALTIQMNSGRGLFQSAESCGCTGPRRTVLSTLGVGTAGIRAEEGRKGLAAAFGATSGSWSSVGCVLWKQQPVCEQLGRQNLLCTDCASSRPLCA